MVDARAGDFLDPELIAAELRRWRVPALEIAVVRDGEVLAADAFGLADRESPAPAGPATLFHHGSIAKSFTSTLVALLVREGALGWDTRVREVVPWFRVPDVLATERITVRDLLAHRSGIAQHDFVWLAHPDRGRPDLVRRVAHLDGAEFRGGFVYSNLGYAAAGEVVAAVTGSSWEDELERRVLKPAGMGRTTSSFDAAIGASDAARPYGERDGEVVGIAYRRTDVIAPAGGLASCATDMAQWLLALTSPGAVFPAGALDETTTVQVPMPGFGPPLEDLVAVRGYGLGWVNGTFRGHEWRWHSGGLDGFWSHVAVLPDAHAGVVVSANLTATRLPFALMLWCCDRLLGLEPGAFLDDEFERAAPEASEPDAIADAPPSHRLEAFEGAYDHPGYGTLVVEPGVEVVRLGSAVFAAGHRHYDTWNLRYEPFPEVPLGVTFHTDPDGSVGEAWVPFEPVTGPIRFRRTARNP